MSSQPPTVDLDGERLSLQFPYGRESVDKVREIDGAKWEVDRKRWLLPDSRVVLTTLKKIFPTIQFGDLLRARHERDSENVAEATERKLMTKAERALKKIKDFLFKTDPYRHQAISFSFATALDCAALFLDMGLGKTKVLIDLMVWRYRKRQVKRVLIVAPNSVTATWKQEVSKHAGDDFNGCEVLEGSSKRKVARCRELVAEGFHGFIVINYDALLHMFGELLSMQESQDPMFDAMALDESTYVKHASSQRSKLCWRLGKTVQYRNILTGTPVTQSLEDVFAQFRFLKQDLFGPYATAFRGEYLVMGGFENRQVIGYRNVEQALEKIYSVSIRFTKARCLDLPKKVYETRTVRMDEATSKKYRQLEKECVAEFGGSAVVTPLVVTRIMKCAQISGGFVYLEGEDGKRGDAVRFKLQPKLQALAELLEEYPGRKVVVWAHFQEELDIIHEFLDSQDIGCVEFSGNVKKADRDAAKVAFKEDPGVRVFLGQEATGGYGLNELVAASLVIYYSNEHSLEHRLQSHDRTDRIGQTQSVLYVDILAETSDGKQTVDHDIMETLRNTGRFAGEISRGLMQRMATRHGVEAAETVEAEARDAE